MKARIMSEWLQAFFDTTARKPSGWLGRHMYRRPVGHYGFFHVAIDKLQLRPEDVFLEIGCGGGALLDMVLRTVQRACGIDHSPDMVVLAQQNNRRALFEGRVEIIEGDVEALPWAEGTFTCATGVEVLYFIEYPQWALEELRRVLQPDGRLVLVTAAQPRSRLVKWVCSPWLRYMHFHPNDELASMLIQAGFSSL
jgi:ubiquinone/menaquinone biosynthesis C-methylase UbiE